MLPETNVCEKKDTFVGKTETYVGFLITSGFKVFSEGCS